MTTTAHARASARTIGLSLAALPALLSAAPARAQQQDTQAWLQVNATVPVADRVRLTLEEIARASDRQDGVYQTEVGGLLGVRIADHVEFGVGYRWVGAYDGRSANENRLRQQIVASFGRLTTRLRVDERFHPGGDEIGFRIRPLARFNQPLGARRPALFVSHESFFLPNSTRWGQHSGYERMRNMVGLTFPLARGMVMDAGYLNQYRFARGTARAQMDHALSLQLTINLHDLATPHLSD